jgi:pyruvate/2-oxoglutarate dehydrogenase complex dihydrolipoamide acyltransferase (E2) component
VPGGALAGTGLRLETSIVTNATGREEVEVEAEVGVAAGCGSLVAKNASAEAEAAPAANAAAPTAEPAAETAEPAAEPAAETAEPAAEPAAETAEPAAEPAAETAAELAAENLVAAYAAAAVRRVAAGGCDAMPTSPGEARVVSVDERRHDAMHEAGSCVMMLVDNGQIGTRARGGLLSLSSPAYSESADEERVRVERVRARALA